jgi:hypothetical protein
MECYAFEYATARAAEGRVRRRPGYGIRSALRGAGGCNAHTNTGNGRQPRNDASVLLASVAQARLWDRIERSVRVGDFTFPGDPTRIDYCYRHNGTRGFVQTLSVTRSPRDCKEFAYTAERIAKRGPFGSEFVAITDVELQKENPRHQFVSGTLRDAGIEPIALEGFAVWVAKLRAMLQ